MTREEAHDILYNWLIDAPSKPEWCTAFKMAIEALKQDEPKTGYWIYDKDKSNWYDSIYRCSCCERTISIPFQSKADADLFRDYPYCHCGAKMKEEE